MIAHPLLPAEPRRGRGVSRPRRRACHPRGDRAPGPRFVCARPSSPDGDPHSVRLPRRVRHQRAARAPARGNDRDPRGRGDHGRPVPGAGRRRLAGNGARDQYRRGGHPNSAVVLSARAIRTLDAGRDRSGDRRLLRSSDGDAGAGHRDCGSDDSRRPCSRPASASRFLAASPRRSPISAAVSGCWSAPISSISACCGASALPSPRSAAPGRSTAFSWPE